MKNTLQSFRTDSDGRAIFEVITCEPYGRMSDGRMVWQDVQSKLLYLKFKSEAAKEFYFAEM